MTEAELLLAAESMSGIGAWAFDASTCLVQLSPQGLRLHGLPQGRARVQLVDLLATLSETDRPALAAALQAAVAPGRAADIDVTVVVGAGTPRRLRWILAATAAPRRHGTVQAAPRADPLAIGAQAFEMAAAAAGVGVFEVDVESGAETWSDLTLQLYGLPPGSAAPSRQQWRELYLDPADAVRSAERAADFLATGRTYELDYRIRRADDGAVRWLHTRAAFLQGDRRHAVGVSIDITERKQAEDQAQEAWHALDVSATQVGFGFGYRDVRSDVGFWSPQLKTMFGLPCDAPTPSREEFLALIDPADRERVAALIMGWPAVGEVRDFEYRVSSPGGGMRVLMTRAVVRTDAAGRPWRYHFVVIDLTEPRAKDRRVGELLERLQMATEASGVGTWDRDAAADRPYWDATTLGLFGRLPDDPPPTREEYLAIVHPEDRDRVARELDALDQHDSGFEFEFRAMMPCGRLRWLVTRGRAQRDAAGRVVRHTGICFDVTARRQTDAALQAQRAAESANAAKTDFLSRMSHELRTPLNAVLGFAQLMALDERHALAPAQAERLGHIQAAGWHLLALINDVLDLTRIEARDTRLNPSWLALAPLLDECLAMNATAAAQRGIGLSAPRDAHVPVRVWADPTRLKQVLLNLLSNAVKYNRDGGSAALHAVATPEGGVRIEVSDTGSGLSREQQAHLFEPFNRLGRERGPVEGTGIGLALSKLIAEQMGGRLEARSEPGVGSVFSLTLPPGPG